MQAREYLTDVIYSSLEWFNVLVKFSLDVVSLLLVLEAIVIVQVVQCQIPRLKGSHREQQFYSLESTLEILHKKVEANLLLVSPEYIVNFFFNIII